MCKFIYPYAKAIRTRGQTHSMGSILQEEKSSASATYTQLYL